MITLPAKPEAVSLVDWVEASLFTQKRDRISDAALIDVMSEADLEDPDTLLALVTQTVHFRGKSIGAAYPFRRDGQGFARNGSWKDYLPYSFMLFVSLNQSYTELNYKGGAASKPAELFEYLSCMAVEQYLRCSVVRIGAPRRHPVPAQFPKALDYAVEQLGEIVGQRDLENHNSGDDGVDIIAWRTFDDARSSQAVLFAQCAIGTDWKDKRDGISLEMWKRHIDWHSAPLKGFAIPFHHQAGNSWRETATRAGVVFDRLRIAKLLTNARLPKVLATDITAWCEKRRKQIDKLTIESA